MNSNSWKFSKLSEGAHCKSTECRDSRIRDELYVAKSFNPKRRLRNKFVYYSRKKKDLR
jgi:hypothetical protein